MQFSVLDCTLRDGGYYTNWDFDEDLVEAYFASVAKLPIVALEVGYCNHPKGGYRGEWCYLGVERLSWVKSKLRPDQQLGIMLDAKDVAVERLDELLGDLVGIVDLVRMAVAPTQLEHGLALARGLKRMGFAVGFNTMYLSTYSADLDELVPLVDGRDSIDVLSLVDSYGGCTPKSVAASITKIAEMLPGMRLGFHGHENTCLAFANALAAAEAGAEIIDSTFVGMGRGAGNARTEMLLVHQASEGIEVDLDAVAHAVEPFEALRTVYGWGTNLPYMLSGAANLPQKDVMDWLGKNRYSPVSVVRALKSQAKAALDTRAFPALRPNNLAADHRDTVVIVGGGGSVERHGRAIRELAQRSGYYIVHANTRHLGLISDLGPRQLVCLPGHAASHLPPAVDLANVAAFVVPEAPRFPGTAPDELPGPVFQCAPYPADKSGTLGPVSDIGPLALALGAARALSARTIYLVGFDGYENATIAQQELAAEIQATLDRVQAEGDVSVYSLTPTRYVVPPRSIYAELSAMTAH
jgi:4-hydroxy 2-oxovalerate aldolase